MDALDPQAFAEVDGKGFVPDDVRNSFFRKLRMRTENRTCFECSARNPTWISLSYGVYLCLECSGEHRRKGVHISFVRSVELDRFSPDQMVQMALGGNAKAWNHFKMHAMGKTSDGGRPVDYNSNIAKRYKQQLEKDARDMCSKMSISCKETTQAPAPLASDPVDEAADFAGPPSPSNLQTFKSAPAVVQQAPVPKPAAAAPASVVVRKSLPDPTPAPVAKPAAKASSPSATQPTVASPSVVKTTGFAGPRQIAKQIEFDFDFDELEQEASKPAPAPAPKAAASVPTPAPVPSPAPPVASASPQRSSLDGDGASKFAKNKAISSDDFFDNLEQENASQRLERETRYNKFSSASAISSSSFFGNGPEESSREPENWKAAASDYARAGLSKGAELLTTYLNKVRD
mmetsp:Transcript_75071/g.174085  ORF Transcript_75071/g.174085 Transcript_75071/m.174085 type:complete len:403 (-) Transcript_75071:175-1383(-)|eukprot:CAMPEP_0171058384 /NCGR_PEP_ID=MMETSP0766_2-20121228/2465_1 /TAXON_ID=439317 /ORGANISM="Gambierdiscus australes, Strain CAWD 149" /LENGTH=402 /DNA_ID=CAMNT_0011513655 /DNA_START=61 /DNA_END=1269 /DNA_ORIENTATION=-